MTFDDLTPEWLTQLLHPGRVHACSWVRIGEELGFSSKLARLTLEGTGVPRTLIAKCPAKEAEVRIYQEFGDTLPLPGCYRGEAEAYLLLEDVSGRVGDAVQGCPAEDAGRVLQAVAPIHRAFWDGAPPWPRRIGGDPVGAQRNHDARVPVFLERHGDRLPPYHRGLLQRLQPRYGALLERMARTPTTLLHSDLHLENVIFGERIVILDWENPSVGRAVFDVAWFTFPSLRTDERREHGEQLLREYHAALGVPDYSYNAFREELDDALLVLFGAVLNGIARIDPDTCHPRQTEWVEDILAPGNLLQAVQDRDLQRRLS